MIHSRSVPDEALLVVRPVLPTRGLPVMMVHGAEGDPNGAWAWTQYETRTKVPRGCIDAGRVIYSPELGGNHTWGNATCQARINTAYSRMGSSKIILAGQSMGGLGSLTWAANNPTKVAGIILVIPVLHLGSLLSSGYASEVNAAYGGTYSDATYGDYSPIIRLRRGTFPTSIPVQLWYGTSDALCLPQYAQELAAGLSNVQIRPLDGGHEERVVNMVVPSEVTSFIQNL